MIAVPLYLKDDKATSEYFKNHFEEIDAITGPNLTILLARQVEFGEHDEVVKIFDDKAEEGKRFKGVRRVDLPCFWLEDSLGGQAILRLPETHDDLKQTVRILADLAPQARSANDLKVQALEMLSADRVERQPWWGRIREMLGISDTRAAWISGSIFVALMLIIAIFIKDPSPFQYFVFRAVLAISAAAFAAVIPGILNLKLGTWLQAGGAFAVLVLVYLFSPANLVTSPPPTPPITPTAGSK